MYNRIANIKEDLNYILIKAQDDTDETNRQARKYDERRQRRQLEYQAISDRMDEDFEELEAQFKSIREAQAQSHNTLAGKIGRLNCLNIPTEELISQQPPPPKKVASLGVQCECKPPVKSRETQTAFLTMSFQRLSGFSELQIVKTTALNLEKTPNVTAREEERSEGTVGPEREPKRAKP